MFASIAQDKGCKSNFSDCLQLCLTMHKKMYSSNQMFRIADRTTTNSLLLEVVVVEKVTRNFRIVTISKKVIRYTPTY